jgi:hypothetical protein
MPKAKPSHCEHCEQILAEIAKTNRQLNVLLRWIVGTIDISPRQTNSGPEIDDKKIEAFRQSIGGMWAPKWAPK